MLDHPARMFLCARCRAQVVLCSRCDRGQRYCTRACSAKARREAQRAASQRYQRTRAGRMAHAERSRRWRRQHPQRDDAAVDGGGQAHFVTHQGWLSTPDDAPLAINSQAQTQTQIAASVEAVVTSALGALRCRRCAAPLPSWVRLGFVRHGLRRWPARVFSQGP